MEITPEYNMQNIEYIRQMIAKKNSSNPYTATETSVSHIITDMDNFPYNRYYRGVATASDPIIYDREAGWRIRNDNCYKLILPMQPVNQPQHCFQNACTTIIPCHCDINSQYEMR